MIPGGKDAVRVDEVRRDLERCGRRRRNHVDGQGRRPRHAVVVDRYHLVRVGGARHQRGSVGAVEVKDRANLDAVVYPIQPVRGWKWAAISGVQITKRKKTQAIDISKKGKGGGHGSRPRSLPSMRNNRQQPTTPWADEQRNPLPVRGGRKPVKGNRRGPVERHGTGHGALHRQ